MPARGSRSFSFPSSPCAISNTPFHPASPAKNRSNSNHLKGLAFGGLGLPLLFSGGRYLGLSISRQNSQQAQSPCTDLPPRAHQKLFRLVLFKFNVSKNYLFKFDSDFVGQGEANSLHVYQAPRWCWGCWSLDHTWSGLLGNIQGFTLWLRLLHGRETVYVVFTDIFYLLMGKASAFLRSQKKSIALIIHFYGDTVV